MTYQVGQLADRFGLSVEGNRNYVIQKICGLKDNEPHSLSFLSSPKLLQDAIESQIPVFLTRKELAVPGKINLFCEQPDWIIVQCAKLFQVSPMTIPLKLHDSVVLGKDVELGQDVKIGAQCVLGDQVKIGAGTQILPGTIILDRVSIGEKCLIYPNVSIYHDCQIGDGVIIHSGSTLGSDGYGFYFREGKHQKIPQLGRVVIEDEVEIGANCAIDRGRFNETRIGKGTKLDNLVHIAHNVKIGEHSLILGQVGVAGSTELGKHVTMAGQSGAVGHVQVADGVTLMAKSLITKDITEEKSMIAGYPAKPLKLWKRAIAKFYKIEKKNNK